jgi:murein DD-endopeptidase MepM/ murein hydrolase activator NlpD
MRGITILLHRDGAVDSRQVRLPGWALRLALIGGGTLVVVLALAGVLYGPVLRAAARVPLLEREIARLREENGRVTELARRLDEAEAQYAHLRGMLGGGVGLPAAESGGDTEARLYVAPPLMARVPEVEVSGTSSATTRPHRWPLTVASYRTRGLATGDPSRESHQGLDLAVPVGSEVRATGAGTVRATGTDAAYGLYVLLDHGEGYESMYGHLSRVLVARAETVQAGQLVALTGNTGRSTAPHLHFEIRLRGRTVDPLTLVREER